MIVRGMFGILLVALMIIASVQSSIIKPSYGYSSDPSTVYDDVTNFHNSINSDILLPEKRALMRLGKRAYMRLGKRAYLRLGKRAPLRLG
uniref:Uncharacterized protein n=1 Tax=Panagrolaimus sp. ES5 TaxID=591445 RepID=A0AC34F4B3_9BILA